jgi:hypothetical protein
VAETGKELAADLYQILVVGKSDLPTVAAEYREAVSKVDSAGAAAPHAMRRPPFFGADQVQQAWLDLRDELGRFLSESEDSLGDAGRALVMAVDQYAETDTVAAKELDRLREGYEPLPGVEPPGWTR